MINCPACRAANSEEAGFCVACGKPMRLVKTPPLVNTRGSDLVSEIRAANVRERRQLSTSDISKDTPKENESPRARERDRLEFLVAEATVWKDRGLLQPDVCETLTQPYRDRLAFIAREAQAESLLHQATQAFSATDYDRAAMLCREILNSRILAILVL